MADETLTKAESTLVDLLSTPKRRKFVIAYVENGGNGTAAAELAGLGAPAQAASRMLKDDKVIEAIRRYTEIVARVIGETRETVLDRVRNRANSDIGDYFENVPVRDDHGEIVMADGRAVVTQEMKPLSALTREQRMCIKSLTHTAHGVKLELYDASAADRDLGRWLGLDPKENESLTAEGMALAIQQSLSAMDAVGGA